MVHNLKRFQPLAIVMIFSALAACSLKSNVLSLGGKTASSDNSTEDDSDTIHYSEDLSVNYDAVVYVSNTGNDALGLNQVSATAPIRTLARVNELLSKNPKLSMAILFKRGDVWRVSFTTAEPGLSFDRGNVLLGAYGSNSGYARFQMTGDGSPDRSVMYFGNPDKVIVHGLEVYSDNPVKSFRIGITAAGKSSMLKFNDVTVNGFYTNIVINGNTTNGAYDFTEVDFTRVRIINSRTTELPFEVFKGRTNVALGDYSSSSGLYVAGTQIVRIDDSLFANNGNQVVPNNARPHYSYYNHQLYLNSVNNVELGNVIIQRTMLINTFPYLPQWYENNVAATKDFGSKASPWPEGPDGIKNLTVNFTSVNNLFYGNQQPFFARRNKIRIDSNVFLENRSLSKCAASSDTNICTSKWGGATSGITSGTAIVGVNKYDTITGGLVRDNLFAHRRLATAAAAISFSVFLDPDYVDAPNVSGNVIYDWNGGVGVDNATTGLTNANWNLHNAYTEFGKTNPGYPDPGRTIANYAQANGSEQALIDKIMSQPMGIWPSALKASGVNHYLREGFGMTDPK